MKKAICAAVTLVVLLMTACRPTPQAPVVVKKDAERMVEKAQNDEEEKTGIDGLGVPKGRYSAEITGADGKLHIYADAQVKLPNTEVMPIVKASMGLFTQEQTTGIFNLIYPEEKPKLDYGQVETKEVLEQEIIWLKQSFANGEFDSTEEEYEQKLEMMEKSWQSSPEKAPEGGVSDGTLTTPEFDRGGTSRSLSVTNSEYTLWVSTHITKDGINVGQLPFVSVFSTEPERDYSYRNITRVENEGDISDAAKDSLGMTYDEAQEICTEFFEAAGFSKNDFSVYSAYVIDDTGADEIPGTNWAYMLLYTRNVAGIPVFFDESDGEYRYHDDNSELYDKAFSVPWGYEYIRFEIDSKGIVNVRWSNLTDVEDTIEQSAAMMPFEDVMDIFGSMMKTKYEPKVRDMLEGKLDVEIHIEDIELTLLRIREQGGKPTDGMFVPAWVFRGYDKGTDSEGEMRYGTVSMRTHIYASTESGIPMTPLEIFYDICPKERTIPVSSGRSDIYLAINAVDGSIIDLAKGY